MNNNQQLGKFLQTKATKTINNLIWSQGDGICCPEEKSVLRDFQNSIENTSDEVL